MEDLCNASNVVLFSAAPKLQGGDGHVNERRLSYWKGLFEKRGYVLLDIVRPVIWDDNRIQVWYRQNVVVFVNENEVDTSAIRINCEMPVDLIHPDLYELRAFSAFHPIKSRLCRVRDELLSRIRN